MLFLNGHFTGTITGFEEYTGFGEIDGEWANCSYYDTSTQMVHPLTRSFNISVCTGIELVCPD